MSEESKFLKYQDKDGDGLIDVCNDEGIIRVQNCPDCKPNPSAIVPKWKKRDEYSPWFNDKHCTFQITIVTTKTQLLPPDIEEPTEEQAEEYINSLFEMHAGQAVQGLIDGFNKKEGADISKTVRDALDFTKYDLDVRPFSTVKLLYTVSYDVFAPIEERDPPSDDDSDAEESDIVVTYDASKINPKLLKLRKAMYMYARYYRVYQALENGTFIFVDSRKVFTKSQFDKYGDLGFFLGSSRMKDILSDLDNWLNDRGMNIFGVGGGWGWFRDRVTKIEFHINGKKKLTKMKVWTATCREKPKVYKKRRLKALTSKKAWRDPTAVNYFAQLDQIENFLSARVERPWIEFVTTFTYPEVSPEFNYPQQEPPRPNSDKTIGSCVGDALLAEGKQLGQDILDDVFSIGDAIAYTFHKNMCPKAESDIDDERNAIGLAYKPAEAGTNVFGGRKVDFGKVYDKSDGRTKNIFGMATEQAFKQLSNDDQVFAQMCARMLAASLPFPGGGDQMIQDMWKFGFSRIKLCGLLDLMIDAIQCLMKGLKLEEALASALKAALKAMSIENFGDLFVGLPPDKQAELDKLVQQKLASGDIFADGSGAQAVSDAIAGEPGAATGFEDSYAANPDKQNPQPFFGKIKFKTKKPWEDKNLIDRERETLKEGNYPGIYPRDKNMGAINEQRNDRTLAQQYDIVGSAKEQMPVETIMDAYIMALIEVYGDDLLGLTDLLNKYPGAQIIASIIAAVDCPTPPMFDPNFFDFLKSLELPFCRNVNEIALPRLENPFAWLPYLNDIPRLLFEALLLALQQIAIMIIMKILVKVCQIIGDAICKALEIAGALAVASVKALATGDTSVFSEAIKDAICGPDADQEQIDATIADMFEKLGVGGAALADTQAVKNFTNDMSAATTRAEMIDAFMGNPSNDFLDITFTILENQYPQFLEGLPTPGHVASFFEDVGNLFPAAAKRTLAEMADMLPDDDFMPANPSLCATPEDIDNFKERRCLLLEGRASPAQCQQMFQDLQNETLEDLEELTSALHGGIPQLMMDALPPIVSQPGCDDGLIPFESEENKAVVGFALGGNLKQLEIEFAQDMIDKGTVFGGDSGWGFLNMILSDTDGNPFTTHQKKVNNNKNHVDFALESDDLKQSEPWASYPSVIQDLLVPDTDSQHGQYPAFVAEWLWQQLAYSPAKFESTNISTPAKTSYQSFDDLGWEGWFWTDVNLLGLQEYGWNVDLQTQMGAEKLKIVRSKRKKDPDLLLEYTDNSGGYRETEGKPWNWGYDIEFYLSEIGNAAQNSSSAQIKLNAAKSEINFESLVDTSEELIRQREAQGETTSLATEALAESKERLEDMMKTLESTLNKLSGADEANLPDDNARVLIRGKYKIVPSWWSDDDTKVITYQRHEFYSVDNTLDDVDLTQYPIFNSCFVQKRPQIPQAVLLSEILSKNNDFNVSAAAAKISHDSLMTSVTQLIKNEITGPTDAGAPLKESWMFGAMYDSLTLDDMEYVVDKNQTLSAGGTEYAEAEVADYDDDGKRDGNREIENNDSILGISKMQYEEKYNDGPPNRVFYLHPNTYGGSYISPKIYIKPVENRGWRGMVDVIYPEISPCKPSKENLVGFRDIEQDMSSTYNYIPEDQRLKSSEECVVEKPYNRILERSSKTGIQGLLRATCRIFGATHLIKSMPVFSTFGPNFPATCSSLFAAYIVNVMEESLKDAQESAFWEWFNSFKDEEFWYAFLEQAVQTYGRLVDDGTIEDPPEPVLNALFRINDMQELYKYPYGDDLSRARSTGRAEPWPFDTLKSFRYEENLNAVKATEDDAKLILQEMVMREMNIVGELFSQNMKGIGLAPQYTDLDYYTMTNLCNGGEGLDLHKEIKQTTVGVPTEGSGHYTAGDELASQNGEPYVGFYHIHRDDDGNDVYMKGEEHTEEDHETLNLFSSKISMPIGNVADLGTASGDRPFILERYISIDGTKYPPQEAINIIKANNQDSNISDIYPGTLEHVHYQPRDANLYDGAPSSTDSDEETTNTRVVGLKGELGVRYGLQFSIDTGERALLASVEIDSLDVKVSQFPGVWEANTHILYCLIKKLKNNDDFKLATRYIFPLNKIVSLMAIYTDYGLLSSIGEKAVESGDAYSGTLSTKPGIKIQLNEDGEPAEYELTPGWAHRDDRASKPSWPASWFIAELPYDSWDKVLLRNSKSRVKRIFKGYYHQRDFAPWNEDFSPGAIIIKNLKSAFAIPPLSGQMPWWSKRRLVGNPFDADGNLCGKR